MMGRLFCHSLLESYQILKTIPQFRFYWIYFQQYIKKLGVGEEVAFVNSRGRELRLHVP